MGWAAVVLVPMARMQRASPRSFDRVRHGPAAEALHQARHRRRVTQARAVVDVVGAHHGAGELLDEVVLLVGALGGGDGGEGVSACGREPLGHQVERFVPGRLLQRAVPPDERRLQPVRGVDERESKPALHAQTALVGRILALPARRHEPVAGHAQVNAAPAAAVGAGRRHLALGSLETGIGERPGRAALDALAAGNAIRVDPQLARRASDRRVEPALHEVDGRHPDDLVARPHADPAQHADARVELEEGVRGVDRQRPLRRPVAVQASFVDADEPRDPVQLAGVALLAVDRSAVVVDEQELDRPESRLLHRLGVGPDLRSLGHRRVAGGHQASIRPRPGRDGRRRRARGPDGGTGAG